MTKRSVTPRPSKLYWSWQGDAPVWDNPKLVGNLWKYERTGRIEGGLDAYIKIGGQHVGFIRIRKTLPSGDGSVWWWTECLIPGFEIGSMANAEPTLRAAKAKGRKTVEYILSVLRSDVTLLPG